MTGKKPNFQRIFDNYLSKNTRESATEMENPNTIGSQKQPALFLSKKIKPNFCEQAGNIPEKKSEANKTAVPVKSERVKISLTKDGLIQIKPSNKVIACALATQPGAIYYLSQNQWLVREEHYNIVVSELAKNQIPFEKIPAGVIKLLRKPRPCEDFVLTGKVYECLMDFQREAVLFALSKNGRILLADDMGLGKTVQALAIAKYYSLEFPLLIIAPASLLHNWSDAVSQFLNMESTIVTEKMHFGDAISIISYNQASKFEEVIRNNSYGVIICDECHSLKSTTTKRTKVLLPILQKCSRLILISGTPAVSRPLELYTTIQALDKTIFPSFPEYGMRYCNGRKIWNRMDYSGCSNAEELGMILEKEIMIRRCKDKVLSQLPKKFRRCVLIESSKKTKIKNSENIVGDQVSFDIMQQYRDAVSQKKDAVLDYIEGLSEKNIKFLVFAHHQEMMNEIEEFLISRKCTYIRLDGSTTKSKRHALVESYQNDGSIKIALLSITACSTGLTLTAGKAVVFAELYWNPGTMMQAEDRIHRIGQKDSVDIHYLVCKDTIDEVVWPKLLKKLNVLESLGISTNELKLVKGEIKGQAQLRLDKCLPKTK